MKNIFTILKVILILPVNEHSNFCNFLYKNDISFLNHTNLNYLRKNPLEKMVYIICMSKFCNAMGYFWAALKLKRKLKRRRQTIRLAHSKKYLFFTKTYTF